MQGSSKACNAAAQAPIMGPGVNVPSLPPLSHVSMAHHDGFDVQIAGIGMASARQTPHKGVRFFTANPACALPASPPKAGPARTKIRSYAAQARPWAAVRAPAGLGFYRTRRLSPGNWKWAAGQWHMEPGTWELAPCTWHLTSGTCQLAPRTRLWHLASGSLQPGHRN